MLSAALIVLFGAVWLATLVDLAILPVTVAIALIIIYGLHFGTIGYRISPPAGWSTFGEVTRKIVGISMATKRLNIRTEEEILAELRPIIVDVLGVNAKEIVPTARFIEDLGVG